MANIQEWKWSDGFDMKEFSTAVTFEDDYKLKDSEKDLFIAAVASAASKTLTLDLETGVTCLIANVGGTNAFTLKNVSGDSGTSVATGKVAIVFASTTANGSKVYVLN